MVKAGNGTINLSNSSHAFNDNSIWFGGTTGNGGSSTTGLLFSTSNNAIATTYTNAAATLAQATTGKGL